MIANLGDGSDCEGNLLKAVVMPDGKTTVVTEDKLLNAQKPLWARAESEASDEEYKDFYRDLTGDWEEPLLRFSLGRRTTAEEIDRAAELVAAAVEKQRATLRTPVAARR